MKFTGLPLAGILFLTLPGCIPYFSTMERTAEMSGRVIDSHSRLPLAGATVSLHDDPGLRSATTAADGTFHLKPSYNFSTYAMGGICGGGPVPFLNTRSNTLDVFLPGYRPGWADPQEKSVATKDGKKLIFRDIALKKTPH